ncbi:MAG TPA: ribosome-associated ATPase/putative transporter RbbA [Albidovulum sp.]|uniref:ribosome-associated ATPase/putative transporter RbbA n=1 Tax=Albidovulum sp. TaxID=1872424 RepID=UPI002BB5D72B|nr:ribosome-associated ATPase/putative transporter RbbA [Albidovulum sp.]
MTPPDAPEATQAAVATLTGVTHRYRKVVALDDVTVSFPAGRMVGLIGPDGVGKSTLLALIAGVRRAQSGQVAALGGDLRNRRERQDIVRRIAYMPQGLGRNLYPTLSVRENLDFFARLYGLPARARRSRIAELLAATGLAPFPDRPAGKLSGGMRQKLSLCASLLHDPDLLILDEPTTGVDPLSRRQFWDLIARIRARRPGMSVIVATAYMDEAQRFDWLVAVDSGRIAAEGTPADLLARTGQATLEEAFVALLPETRRRGYGGLVVPPREDGDTTAAIEAFGLTKTFGSFTAVDDVSFRIGRGEIFGFLGSNGCGKSTTMKMLTGLIPASAGRALLLGRPVDAGDLGVRRRVGYMSQSFSLYGELTIRQNLVLHAAIFELPQAERAPRVAELLADFDLVEVADSLPEALPLGVRQRLQLAVAVLHRPEVLILDEPTSGVDPVARDAFWRYLVTLSRRDRITIFLSTHFMNEAERCDRVSLMHAGRVLAVGAPVELAATKGNGSLETAFIAYLLEASGAPEAAEPDPGAPEADAAAAPAGRSVRTARSVFDLARLWAYARRETVEILRDPIRITFALAGPLILMLAFGFGISFDVENLSYAVLDQDRTPESRLLLESFEGSRNFARAADPVDLAAAERTMRRGKLVLLIEIPAGFGRDLRAGRPTELAMLIDGAAPFRAETARGYVAGVMATMIARLSRTDPAFAGTDAAVEIGARFRYNQDFRSSAAIVPGIIMLMMILIPAMMTAIGVVREKETGSITNFRATPVTRIEFLLGKQAPYVALAFASFLSLVAMGWLVFDVPVRGSLPALMVSGLFYVAATTGYGLLMSSFTRSQAVALFLTPISLIPPAMNFSGMLTPASALGVQSWYVGRAFPAAWFQDASVGAITKGLGFADLWQVPVVLALFAVLYILAAAAALPKQER